MVSYAVRREELYGPLRAAGVFTWDWLYGKEYALASMVSISPQERRELSRATELLGGVFARTVAAVQQGGDELAAGLGIPAAAREAARLAVWPGSATLIGRFDFVRTGAGWKLLEFNSDTPGGVVEAFLVNGKACAFFGAKDPNAGAEEELRAAFARMIDRYRALGYKTGSVWFSALDWHAEDAGTARYLLACSGLEARFAALGDLRLVDGSLCVLAAGELLPVDVWYRLHPLGILAGEQDADGYPTGAAVLKLIAGRRLAVINPPGALLAQTKALQALIWALYEAGEFFGPEEAAAVGAYMLPTYLENRFAGRPYVAKPVLGREGGGVTIYGADGSPLESAGGGGPAETLVYQQYQELETAELETMDGLYQGRLIWGSFLIDGRASALCVRAGGRITDDMSYFVPVGLEE